MSIQSGTYTIINVHYSNFANLPSSNDQEQVICTIGSNASERVVTEAEQWTLTYRENERYLIQNVKFGSYVRAAANAKEGEEVYATSEFKQSWWKIRKSVDEQYFICPIDDPNLCWSLCDERDGTAVELQPTRRDNRCLWRISSYPPLNSKVFSFLDALTVSLGLAEPTSGKGDFPVRVDLDGLPPSSVIRFLDPLLILFSGHVIAEARVPNLTKSSNGRLFATLRIRDMTGFLTFATSVLQNKKVQVALEAGRFNLFSDIAGEDDNQVFRMVKTLTFQGFDSFRERVRLSDVRITGSESDERGEYMTATAIAIITNASPVDITTSVTVSVYYRQIKIGSAALNGLHLQRGANKLQLAWKFQPSTLANEDIQNFLNRYITTKEDIPISLQVDDICPNICNHPFDLPSLDVLSYIPGLNAGLVNHVDAYLGLAIVFQRTVAFVFEFENPLDAQLTIRHIELDAFIQRKRIVTVKHTFESFIIPGRGRKKSPKIKDACLVQGYLEALQRIASKSATLDVDVTAVSVCVDNFHLQDLKFHLKEIPFEVHIRL